jgi:hypothetical protein
VLFISNGGLNSLHPSFAVNASQSLNRAENDDASPH